MSHVVRAKSPRTRAKKSAEPPLASEVDVQLATLADAPPVGDAWVFETKYDGYRIVARIHQGAATLSTRNGLDFTKRAQVLADKLSQLPASCLIDGELVSPPRDKTSKRRAGDFQALQNALKDGKSTKLLYYAFDLLFLDGRDLRDEPLHVRKAKLAELVRAFGDPHLRYSDHFAGDGAAFYEKARELGLEGIIAKRVDGRYVAGRGRSWLKIKCLGRQEFVVIGYTPPQGTRQHFGALLLATRDTGGALRYVGKVGTGFSQASLLEVKERMAPLARKTCPVTPAPLGPEVRGARFLEPTLVAEVEFTEFTADGHVRHPSFQGLRDDKPARTVQRERVKKD